MVQMCALDLEMGQGKGKREMNPKQRKKKEIKKKIFSGIQCRQHCRLLHPRTLCFCRDEMKNHRKLKTGFGKNSNKSIKIDNILNSVSRVRARVVHYFRRNPEVLKDRLG